ADLHELVLLHRTLLEVCPSRREENRQRTQQKCAAFHRFRQPRRKSLGGGNEQDRSKGRLQSLAGRKRRGGQQLTAFDSDARVLTRAKWKLRIHQGEQRADWYSWFGSDGWQARDDFRSRRTRGGVQLRTQHEEARETRPRCWGDGACGHARRGYA